MTINTAHRGLLTVAHGLNHSAMGSGILYKVESVAGPVLMRRSFHQAQRHQRRRSIATPAATSTMTESPPMTPPHSKSRVLPLRKQFLMEQYRHILTSSAVVVFLRPRDFSVAELTRLRVDLSMIAETSKDAKAINQATADAAFAGASVSSSASESRPRFVYLRPGLLGPTLRQMQQQHPALCSAAQSILAQSLSEGGNLAALTIPTLHPPSLQAALAAIYKLAKSPNARLQAKTTAAGARNAAAKAADSKSSGTATRLSIVAALVEQKATTTDRLTVLSNLPELSTLHSQIVGLISQPGQQLAGLLQQASGAGLLRVLAAHQSQLETVPSDEPAN